MAKKPPILKLHELKPQQPMADVFALLAEKNLTTTKDGKKFYKCRFRDQKRSLEVAVWQDKPLFHDAEHWQPGMVYKLRGVYWEHDKYGPVLDLEAIREASVEDEADGFSLDDFIERSRTPPGELFEALHAVIDETLDDEPLHDLTLALLDEHRETLESLPASAKHYYPYPGGWLEHTLNVVKTCIGLADQYAERFPDTVMDRSILFAAAALHEIGRVKDLSPGQQIQVFEPTVEGRLLGHVILGRDMVRDAARAAEIETSRAQLLDHVLLAYLEHPEWGSPRLPLVVEALILHHADDLDAKFEMFARALKKDHARGAFTDRDAALGKSLLKREPQ